MQFQPLCSAATVMKRLDISQWENLPDGYFFTIREVTEILNVSDGAVRNAIHSCKLRAVRLTGAGKGPYRVAWHEKNLSIEGTKKGSKLAATSGSKGLLRRPRAWWHPGPGTHFHKLSLVTHGPARRETCGFSFASCSSNPASETCQDRRKSRAGEGIRTPDVQLGKLALCH